MSRKNDAEAGSRAWSEGTAAGVTRGPGRQGLRPERRRGWGREAAFPGHCLRSRPEAPLFGDREEQEEDDAGVRDPTTRESHRGFNVTARTDKLTKKKWHVQTCFSLENEGSPAIGHNMEKAGGH